MRVKCVGGPLDGYWQEVDNYNLRSNEIVRLPKPIIGLTCASFNPEVTPEVLEAPYYYYKLSSFHFSTDIKTDFMWFLIPENWSNKEAVLYQFGK